jgi:hypothetical protein
MQTETETIIMLVGNCGSGKTMLGRSLAGRLGAQFVDDPKGIEDVTRFLNQHRTIVIADPWLCLVDVRQRATAQLKEFCPEAQLLWYFFENNPEQCRKNIERRLDKYCGARPVDYKYFADHYEFPAELLRYFPLIPVWKGVL